MKVFLSYRDHLNWFRSAPSFVNLTDFVQKLDFELFSSIENDGSIAELCNSYSISKNTLKENISLRQNAPGCSHLNVAPLINVEISSISSFRAVFNNKIRRIHRGLYFLFLYFQERIKRKCFALTECLRIPSLLPLDLINPGKP